MSEDRVHGIVLAHGEMAQGMISAVGRIAGSTEDMLTPLSNYGLGPDVLATEIAKLANGPTIVFTDLQSGSCGFAARRCLQNMPRLVVITGVNLSMLIYFVMNKEMPLEQLVPMLLTKGRQAISCSPATFENYEHRAVSGG